MSMLVIFLDIDGVLNNQTYFINNSDRIAKFYDIYSDLQYDNNFDLHVERIMMDIDEEKLSILKKIVLDTDAKWVGVTYKEDKDMVVFYINGLIEDGKYPSNLWSE